MSDRADGVQRVVGTSTVVIGVTNVLAPRLSGRFWGIPPDAAPVVPHLGRIYGLALAGLGALSLMVDERERRDTLRLGAVVAGGTAAADVLAWARGQLGARGAVTGAVAAGVLAALAWTGSREEKPA